MSNKLIVRTPSGVDTTQAVVDALATGVLSVEAVAELFGTTKGVLLQLLSDPQVIARIEARREQLYSQLDVARRLKRKALWAVESAVPRLAELAHDVEVAPAARVAAMAELVKISGLRERENNDRAAERVVINIHTGKDTITIEAAARDADGADGATEPDTDTPTVDARAEPPEEPSPPLDNELQINIETPRGSNKKDKPKVSKLRVQL